MLTPVEGLFGPENAQIPLKDACGTFYHLILRSSCGWPISMQGGHTSDSALLLYPTYLQKMAIFGPSFLDS
jgi:hypothetical protein